MRLQHFESNPRKAFAPPNRREPLPRTFLLRIDRTDTPDSPPACRPAVPSAPFSHYPLPPLPFFRTARFIGQSVWYFIITTPAPLHRLLPSSFLLTSVSCYDTITVSHPLFQSTFDYEVRHTRILAYYRNHVNAFSPIFVIFVGIHKIWRVLLCFLTVLNRCVWKKG